MDQNLTADENIKLETKLRLVTARFALQRRDDALLAARGAVTQGKGLALQACCKTLLGRDDFEDLLDKALSNKEPTSADELLAAFQEALIMDPAVPVEEGADDPGQAGAQPVTASVGPSLVSATALIPLINEADQQLAHRREVATACVAEREVAATTCLRAWLQLLLCCRPSEVWDAAGRLSAVHYHGRVTTTAELLSRFNRFVDL